MSGSMLVGPKESTAASRVSKKAWEMACFHRLCLMVDQFARSQKWFKKGTEVVG